MEKKLVKKKLENIKRWWEGKNKKPIVFFAIDEEKQERRNLNLLWKNENTEPNFEEFVDWQIQNLKGIYFLGESYPILSHSWGSRGTPMTMASYLGGKVFFREQTVWVDKTIDNWERFNIEFNPENYWVKKSKELMEKQIKKIDENMLIAMPDLGDALTCFSLLRGVENLLFDIIEQQEIILEKIKEFTDAWKKAHHYFYGIYKEKFPGDCSWLIWAPGKTNACQCDFSTMISPNLFEKFIVFELEQIKEYLDYIVWHLDGPDEIKHVDMLLALPYIKAIQIVPGAGKPPCASSLWLPIIKKITERGKNVIVYANSKEEVKTLINSAPKEKMAISLLEMQVKNRQQAEKIIEWINSL